MENLRRSQQAFTSPEYHKALFEDTDHAIAFVDAHGNFIDCNAKFCDILQYSFAELKQKKVEDITEGSDIFFEQQNKDSVIQGEQTLFKQTKTYRRKDGKRIRAKLVVHRIPEIGEFDHFVSHSYEAMDLAYLKKDIIGDQIVTRVEYKPSKMLKDWWEDSLGKKIMIGAVLFCVAAFIMVLAFVSGNFPEFVELINNYFEHKRQMGR